VATQRGEDVRFFDCAGIEILNFPFRLDMPMLEESVNSVGICQGIVVNDAITRDFICEVISQTDQRMTWFYVNLRLLIVLSQLNPDHKFSPYFS
jgi:hypothetical protein